MVTNTGCNVFIIPSLHTTKLAWPYDLIWSGYRGTNSHIAIMGLLNSTYVWVNCALKTTYCASEQCSKFNSKFCSKRLFLRTDCCIRVSGCSTRVSQYYIHEVQIISQEKITFSSCFDTKWSNNVHWVHFIAVFLACILHILIKNL